jgi:hypothetical protein
MAGACGHPKLDAAVRVPMAAARYRSETCSNGGTVLPGLSVPLRELFAELDEDERAPIGQA